MRAWWLVLAAGAMACGKPEVEGSAPGDCEDRADNDADGFFDCDDNGCWGSPVCSGNGIPDTDDTESVVDTDDGGGGGGTNGTVDTDPVVTGDGVNARFKSMSVIYRLDITWDQAGSVTCNNYFDVNTPEEPGPDTYCNCTAIFRGQGVLDDVLETRNRYIGTWERVSSNCAKAPESQGAIVSGMSIDESSVYFNKADPTSFHTWRFTTDGSLGKEWVAHEDEDADSPCMTLGCQSAIELGHFWIRFNRPQPAISPETLGLSYREQGPFLIASQGITMNLVHQLEASFSESFTPPAYPAEPAAP